jgi:hypothetical protein
MTGRGNPEPYRKIREELADYTYQSEKNEKQGSDFCHEMRGIEEMERLKNPQSYQEVSRKNPEDVEAADFERIPPPPSQTEKESDREKQNGERARIYAVNGRRNQHKRSK